MAGFQPLKLTKPVLFYQKKLKLQNKDFFIALTKSAINLPTNIATLNIQQMASDSIDILSALSLADNAEQKAYLWIHKSIARTCEKVFRNNQQLLDEIIQGKNDITEIIKNFEQQTENLEVTIDYNFFLEPHKLNLFRVLLSQFTNYLSKYNITSNDLNNIIAQLEKRFLDELNDEYKINQNKYDLIEEYFNSNIMRRFYEEKQIANDNYFKELNPFPRTKLQIVGRDKDVLDIYNAFTSGESYILIAGLGGIGKSALLIEYLNRFKHEYDHLIWISQLEIKEEDRLGLSILRDYTLLKNINFTANQEISIDDNIQILFSSLQKITGNNLIVLDNVDESVINFMDSIPSSNWKLLATSRSILEKFHVHKLEPLNDESAIKLFEFNYPSSSVYANEIKEILEIVGNHTLTIEILSKLIFEREDILNPREVLHLLQEQKIDDESLQVLVKLPSLTPNTNIKNIKIYSYLLSIFKLSNLSEKELIVLRDFSVLPSLPVDYKFIQGMVEMGNLKYDEFLEEATRLSTKSWIIFDTVNKSFRCHQMIQEIVRHLYQPLFDNHKGLLAYLTANLHHPNLSVKKDLLRFNEAAIKYFKDDFPEIKFWHYLLAETYRSLGELKKAEEILKNIGNSDLENYPVMLVGNMIQKSEIALETGDFENAKLELLNALQITDEYLKNGDRTFFLTKISLLEKIASYYFTIGDFKSSETRYSELFNYVNNNKEFFENELSKDFSIARGYYGLGRTNAKKGTINLAIDNFNQSVKLLEGCLNSNELATKFPIVKKSSIEYVLGLCYSYIGDLLMETEDYRLAVIFIQKDFELAFKALQENPLSEQNSIECAISLSKLGDYYVKIGDNKEALKRYQKNSNTISELAEKNPDSHKLKFYLVTSLKKEIEINFSEGNTSTLVPLLDRAFDIINSLYNGNKYVKSYFQTLLEITGYIQRTIDHNEFPIQSFRIAEFMFTTVKEANSEFLSEMERVLMLSVQSHSLSTFHIKECNYEQAMDYILFTIQSLDPIINKIDDIYREGIMETLAQSYRSGGFALGKTGQLELSIAYFKKAIENWDLLFKVYKKEKYKNAIVVCENDINEVQLKYKGKDGGGFWGLFRK